MRKLALITGGSGGIGASTALALSEDHDLALGYAKQRDRAERVAEEIRATNPLTKVHLFGIPLRDHEGCAALVTQVKTTFAKSPDVLVTLSGGLHDALYLGSDFRAHEAVIAEHLLVPMSLCHLLLGDMYKNRFGRIVNISSISAKYAKRGQASYAAAKSAVEGFSKTLALEVAHRGITVNVVAPGLIDTSFSAPYVAGLVKTDADVKRRIPAGYVGEPRDVAQIIRFLCSEDARYITGAVHTVDGGRSLGDPSS
jgi:NAD(P)-dependent dehydrogenase (short-subunit alcohol dehydrogenase family)